jgi:hypothetical protein
LPREAELGGKFVPVIIGLDLVCVACVIRVGVGTKIREVSAGAANVLLWLQFGAEVGSEVVLGEVGGRNTTLSCQLRTAVARVNLNRPTLSTRVEPMIPLMPFSLAARLGQQG